MFSAQSENLDNSRIALRKVRFPTLADRVRILTLPGSILELSVRMNSKTCVKRPLKNRQNKDGS